MTWFKRKPKVTPDDIIASLISCGQIKRVGGTDSFMANGIAWTYYKDRIVNQRGEVAFISPASSMFLAAHIVAAPVITLH